MPVAPFLFGEQKMIEAHFNQKESRMLTNANDSTHDSTKTQRWNEKTARHFHAERENGQRQIDDECQYQQPNGLVDTRTGRRDFNGRIDIGEVAVVIAGIDRIYFYFPFRHFCE